MIFAGRHCSLSSVACPDQTSPEHFQRLSMINDINLMAKRIVIDAPKAPALSPNNRHIHTSVRAVIPVTGRKRSDCKYVYGWINMQIILLADHVEIFNPSHQFMFRLCDPNSVLLAVTVRVSYKVTTGYKLPKHIIPKRITHLAMASRQTRPLRKRLADIFGALPRQGSHGPEGHNQIERFEVFHIVKTTEGIDDLHGHSVRLQEFTK